MDKSSKKTVSEQYKSRFYSLKKNCKQRFKGRNRELLFPDNRPEPRWLNRCVWRRKWVMNIKNIKILLVIVVVQQIMQRTFYAVLEEASKVKICKRSDVNLRMDAMNFKKFRSIGCQGNLDGSPAHSL